jgi:hypothetical protein
MLPTQVRSLDLAVRRRLMSASPRGGDVPDAVLLENGNHGREIALDDELVGAALKLALRGRCGGRRDRTRCKRKDDDEAKKAHTTPTRRARSLLRVNK